MVEEIKSKINELIYSSGCFAKSYEFKNELPQRNNGVELAKWRVKEVEEICEQIDLIEEKNGLKNVCKKGCAECCKQCIVVISSECPPIEAYLNNLEYETREYIKNKTLELCAFLENNGFNNSTIVNVKTKEQEKKVQEEYFKLGKECIFLNEKNECMIHPVRPASCWSYREYYDSSQCKESCFSDTSFKYDDWEIRSTLRLNEVRKMHRKNMLLPFAIKEMMHW